MSEIQKAEFKALYLQGWTAIELRKRYRVRTKTAIDFARSCTDDYVRSRNNTNRKLTKTEVKMLLIERMRDGVKMKDLATKYKISEPNVSNICAGRSWKHIFQGVKSEYNKEILSVITL